MTGLSVLLAYASWAAAPLVAYAALELGLRRSPRGFGLLLALYSAAVWLVWAALRVEVDGAPYATVAPLSVLGPWAGVMVLSLVLFAVGARIGGGE
ncbi:hypothetical protein RGUI_1894 [Rhodovulum sp. P5]|uniref:hypothetical protein n=1 Tax=Rhodovulum sp. P5 TaxID=1564506 RepID=UPI0009C24A01|nr:hypothetical protein [Rhodovulum sp. P5]ARE40035.1 hypothetical protein RGUI_1894 [Rhodovulum sp. P5]